MFAPLASRQVAIIARSSNLRQFVGGFPVQAIFTPNQAMMFSTSAIRKDIDSAAKYIGAGFFEILVLNTFLNSRSGNCWCRWFRCWYWKRFWIFGIFFPIF